MQSSKEGRYKLLIDGSNGHYVKSYVMKKLLVLSGKKNIYAQKAGEVNENDELIKFELILY